MLNGLLGRMLYEVYVNCRKKLDVKIEILIFRLYFYKFDHVYPPAFRDK